jgi:hypothetical protein
MYNELFESIIRTSGENTDILDDFDDKDNFWASVHINGFTEQKIKQIFEQVLHETKVTPSYFALMLQKLFMSKIKICMSIDFFQDLVQNVVSDLLKQDEEKEGLIFINEKEINFIKGKNIITGVRAFSQFVISHCEYIAREWQQKKLKNKNSIEFISFFTDLENTKRLLPIMVKTISEAYSYDNLPDNEKTTGYSVPPS